MGMGQELKEFAAGFQSGFKMMEDSEYKKALAKYYKSKGGGSRHYGYGSSDDDNQPGVLGKLFGASDPNEGLSDFERGSKNLVGARSRAFAAGDVGAVEKLDKDIIKYNAMKPADGGNSGGNAVDVEDDDEEEVEENAMGGLAGSAIRQAVNAEPMSEASQEEPQQAFDVTGTMSGLAMPGVDAGLRDLNERLKPEGAVMADPREQEAKFAAFANNDGAATPAEIARLNEIVDPEKKLPPEALSSARIAAVYEFYDKKGDPDQGAALANRLLLADKANSQTRGALALEAIQNGDIKNGAKLIADAYNLDLPGDMQIQPAVADDGSITAKIIKGGVTQEEINANPAQLAAMAKEVASGKAYTDQLSRLAAEAKARQTKTAKTGTGSAPAQAVDTNDLENKLTALKRQYASAETAEEKNRIEDQARAIYNQIRSATAAGMKKGKSPEWALGQRGITPLAPGAAPAPTSAKQSAAAAEAANVANADNQAVAIDRRAVVDAMGGVDADTREAIPVGPNGMRSEGGAVANASRQAIDSLMTGNLGARKADMRADVTKDADVKGDKRDEVYSKVEDAIAGSEDITKRTKGREAKTLANVGVTLAQKNNLTSNQVTSLLEQAIDPGTPIRFDGKGRVQIGDNRPVVMDGATARQLINAQKTMTARLKPIPEKERNRAVDILNRGGDRDGMRKYFIENGFNPTGL